MDWPVLDIGTRLKDVLHLSFSEGEIFESVIRLAVAPPAMGIPVKKPEELRPAWDEAIGSDRLCLIHARVGPDVPTLPLHVTIEEAKSFATALAKGNEAAGGNHQADPEAGRFVGPSAWR